MKKINLKPSGTAYDGKQRQEDFEIEASLSYI
jgi:hypothetical protein